MPLFKKKPKKIITYDTKGKEIEPVPVKVPELEVPRPDVREIEPPAQEEPAIEPPATEDIRQEIENDPGQYFDNLRDYAFIEGLSFAIATLRQAQNDIIRRQRER
jgi:hypothetical protein